MIELRIYNSEKWRSVIFIALFALSAFALFGCGMNNTLVEDDIERSIDGTNPSDRPIHTDRPIHRAERSVSSTKSQPQFYISKLDPMLDFDMRTQPGTQDGGLFYRQKQNSIIGHDLFDFNLCNFIFAYDQQHSLRLIRDIGIEFVAFPNSAYLVGGAAFHGPRRLKTLNSFAVSRYEISLEQWSRFIDQSNYVTDAERKGWSWVPFFEKRGQTKALKWEKVNGANWRHPFGPSRSVDSYDKYSRPCRSVSQISPNDAHAFAKYYGLRLPNNEEWEVATRTFHSDRELIGRKYLKRPTLESLLAKYLRPENRNFHSIKRNIIDLLYGLAEIVNEIGELSSSGESVSPVRGGSWLEPLIETRRYGKHYTLLGKHTFLKSDEAYPHIGFRVCREHFMPITRNLTKQLK